MTQPQDTVGGRVGIDKEGVSVALKQKSDRDREIRKLRQRGLTYNTIAERYGITGQRVHQICKPEKAMLIIHMDYAPIPECKMGEFTYGEVCIKCNVCGRFKDEPVPTEEEVRRELKGE